MDLFNQDIYRNLLPYDGTVHYLGMILEPGEANHYLQLLLKDVPWKNDEAIIYGKHIVTKRKVAWYGDEGFAYTYSNTTKFAIPWTEALFALKTKVETAVQKKFNSCLLNLYHDGSEGMTWHSDDEEALGKNTTIASLSLGAERKFSFKHKRTKQTVSMILENSGLLIMKGETQTHWLHSLPKTTRVTRPRVNLTFRTFLR